MAGMPRVDELKPVKFTWLNSASRDELEMQAWALGVKDPSALSKTKLKDEIRIRRSSKLRHASNRR